MDENQYPNPVQLRDQLVERLRLIEKRLNELLNERETLQSDLAVTDRFLDVWTRANNVQGPQQPRPIVTLSGPYRIFNDASLPARKPKNPPREQVVEAVLEIISERGAPVSRGDLYEALQARGIKVYGKDPVMVLSTMLWRSQDRIVRLGNQGYWIKDRPYELANYFPQLADPIGVAETEPEDGVIEDPDDDGEMISE